MADVKISALTAVASFVGAQEFAVNDAGTTKKATGTQVLAFVAANLTGFVPNARTITAGTGLSGGGDLSANRTVSFADIADQRFLGNISGGATAPIALTATQVTAALDVMTGGGGTGLKGLVPAQVAGDVTKFLRGDGTWQTAGGGSPGGSDTQVQYNNAGAFAGSAALFWDNTNRLLGIGLEGSTAFISAAAATTTNSEGSSLTVEAGAGDGDGSGGILTLRAGAGGATGSGGNVNIASGDAGGGDGDGGSFTFTIGAGHGTGANGNFIIENLPSSDPGEPGALYQAAGVVMVSL